MVHTTSNLLIKFAVLPGIDTMNCVINNYTRLEINESNLMF